MTTLCANLESVNAGLQIFTTIQASSLLVEWLVMFLLIRWGDYCVYEQRTITVGTHVSVRARTPQTLSDSAIN